MFDGIESVVKKRYIIALIEMGLLAVIIYASDKLGRRAVMFDYSLEQFYELLCCHATTAFIVLPLLSVGYIFVPKIPRFATFSVSVRTITLSVAAISVYFLVWCLLNWPIRPPGLF